MLKVETGNSLELDDVYAHLYSSKEVSTDIDVITSQGSSLTTLNCTTPRTSIVFVLTPKKVEKIFHSCNKLESLTIELLNSVDSVVQSIAAKAEELKCLKLIFRKGTAERAFSDADAQTLMKGCCKLEKLHVEGETNLSSETVNELKKRFTHFEVG